MCASAALQARVDRIVYGAAEPKTGAAGSVINLFDNAQLNHQTRVTPGVMAQESSELLQRFFETRRAEQQLFRTPLREDALRTPLARFDGMNLPLPMSRYTSELPALQGLRLHWFDNRADITQPPTVCLHGPEDWSARYLPELRSDAPTIALDWPGFGLSDKPKKESAHSWSWHAQVLQEFLHSLHPQPKAIMLPSTLKAVRHELISGRYADRVGWDPVRPPLSADLQQAPYPDRGHQSGPRAWRALLATVDNTA